MGDFDRDLRDIYIDNRVPDSLKKLLGEHIMGHNEDDENSVVCENCGNRFDLTDNNEQCTNCNLLYKDPGIKMDFIEESIEYTRETFEWGSFGVDGNEDIKRITLKDISDSHLVHIIGHLILCNRIDTLILMLEEARYRSEKKIFVPDYE